MTGSHITLLKKNLEFRNNLYRDTLKDKCFNLVYQFWEDLVFVQYGTIKNSNSACYAGRVLDQRFSTCGPWTTSGPRTSALCKEIYTQTYQFGHKAHFSDNYYLYQTITLMHVLFPKRT